MGNRNIKWSRGVLILGILVVIFFLARNRSAIIDIGSPKEGNTVNRQSRGKVEKWNCLFPTFL